MKPVALIGAASGWGAGFGHTEAGPTALRDLGLDRWLEEAGIAAAWQAMIAPERSWHDAPELRGAAAFPLVARHAAKVADAVAAAIAAGQFPAVIGGDHAVAMGTWGGVARALDHRPLGLIWFDAHLDAHTLETTPSMNAHGMGAAALLGHGHAPFRAIAGGALRPEHLCYVGIRSYEPGEMALLRRLGVRIILMEEVARRGIAAALDEALAIATRGTAAFGITIDLDGFDPEDVPGVGLKVPNGPRGAPTLAALAPIARHPALAAIELVEYIPEFDKDLRTARLARDILISLLAPQPTLADTAAFAG
jgi:arginase